MTRGDALKFTIIVLCAGLAPLLMFGGVRLMAYLISWTGGLP